MGFFQKFFPKYSGFRKVALKFWKGRSLFGVGEGVFDCWACCIHKCYQCFKLGVRNENYKNDVRLRNDEMMVHFFFAYERISIRGSGGGSHSCSHGGAQIFLDASVHEIGKTVLQAGIEGCMNYMSKWGFLGYNYITTWNELQHLYHHHVDYLYPEIWHQLLLKMY